MDSEEKMMVELMSRKYKVNPDNNLLEALDELDEVTYKIV